MLGYTSNLVSSGLREIIRFLVQHKYISGIVTTAGGIEEDLIKCLGPTYLTHTGDFNVDGAGLRKRGLNRIGNLIVPNDNYCKFEDWVMPILDEMVEEQVKDKKVWSPSTVIARLGKEINNDESILYWAAKVSLTHLIDLAPTEAEQMLCFTERHTSLLPGSDRWVARRHAVLPLLQSFNAISSRYCSRYPQNQRHEHESAQSWNGHSWGWCVQASDS